MNLLKIKDTHGVILYDPNVKEHAAEKAELEKELKEKDEYINKLSRVLEKQSVILLHQNSICSNFKQENINEIQFINKILKLSEQSK